MMKKLVYILFLSLNSFWVFGQEGDSAKLRLMIDDAESNVSLDINNRVHISSDGKFVWYKGLLWNTQKQKIVDRKNKITKEWLDKLNKKNISFRRKNKNKTFEVLSIESAYEYLKSRKINKKIKILVSRINKNFKNVRDVNGGIEHFYEIETDDIKLVNILRKKDSIKILKFEKIFKIQIPDTYFNTITDFEYESGFVISYEEYQYLTSKYEYLFEFSYSPFFRFNKSNSEIYYFINYVDVYNNNGEKLDKRIINLNEINISYKLIKQYFETTSNNGFMIFDEFESGDEIIHDNKLCIYLLDFNNYNFSIVKDLINYDNLSKVKYYQIKWINNYKSIAGDKGQRIHDEPKGQLKLIIDTLNKNFNFYDTNLKYSDIIDIYYTTIDSVDIYYSSIKNFDSLFYSYSRLNIEQYNNFLFRNPRFIFIPSLKTLYLGRLSKFHKHNWKDSIAEIFNENFNWVSENNIINLLYDYKEDNKNTIFYDVKFTSQSIPHNRGTFQYKNLILEKNDLCTINENEKDGELSYNLNDEIKIIWTISDAKNILSRKEVQIFYNNELILTFETKHLPLYEENPNNFFIVSSENKRYLLFPVFDILNKYQIKIVDLEKRKYITTINYQFNNQLFYRPSFHNKFSVLMMPINEFHFEILDLENNGEKLADYYYYSEDEWYIITPEGFYDKSPGNSDRLYWVYDNKEIYELKNFQQDFQRDALKDIILDGKYKEEVLQKAHNSTFEEIFKQNIPPYVDIELQEDQLRYTIIARNHQEVNPDKIVVNINGKDRPKLKLDLSKREGDTIRGVIKLNEYSDYMSASGKTPIHIRAYTNSEGFDYYYKSHNEEYEYKTKTKDTKPNFYMLFVGIKDFINPKYKLHYSTKDAVELEKSLSKISEGLFNDTIDGQYLDRVHTKILTDSLATKSNIIAQLESIKKTAKENDVVLLYFSTHGISYKYLKSEGKLSFVFKDDEIKDNYFMLTYDINKIEKLNDFLTDRDGNIVTSDYAIAYSEIDDYLKSWNPYTDILIVDACYSGLINNYDTNKNIGDYTRKELLKTFNSHSGTYTITASTSDEVAKEKQDYEHSVLTYGLLSALIESHKDIYDQSKILTIENWYNTTFDLLKDIQKPTISVGVKGKTPIGVVNDTITEEIKDYINNPKVYLYIDSRHDESIGESIQDKTFNIIIEYIKKERYESGSKYAVVEKHDENKEYKLLIRYSTSILKLELLKITETGNELELEFEIPILDNENLKKEDLKNTLNKINQHLEKKLNSENKL